MKTLRESDIEKYLVKCVKELGGEVRKVAWVGRQGAPDRLVMLPSRKIRREDEFFGAVFESRPEATVWIELKAPGKAATFPANAHERKQHREHERLRKLGARIYVVDSLEQVDELLR